MGLFLSKSNQTFYLTPYNVLSKTRNDMNKNEMRALFIILDNGTIDENGKRLPPFSEVVYKDVDGKTAVYDEEDNLLIPPKYDSIENMCNGIAAVELNGKWGYVNLRGEEIVPFEYDEADIFTEGFAGVRLGDKWGFINAKGERICEFVYDEVYFFKKGKAKVILGEEQFFIGTDGNRLAGE